MHDARRRGMGMVAYRILEFLRRARQLSVPRHELRCNGVRRIIRVDQGLHMRRNRDVECRGDIGNFLEIIGANQPRRRQLRRRPQCRGFQISRLIVGLRLP